MVVVSHDRKLLNHIDSTHELNRLGIASYGGNYDFYRHQKGIQLAALCEEVAAKERSLVKAKATARDTLDRQLKLNARGKKKQQKSGMPKIVMNSMRNKAENSTARLAGTNANRLESLAKDLQEIKTKLPIQDAMKLALADPEVHKRKLLFESQHIQYSFDEHQVWAEPVDLYVNSGDRIAIKGRNGSGKSTLLQVVLGNLSPTEGTVYRADVTSVNIDQDYSLIQNHLSVYEQAKSFASVGIADHEVRTRLHRFLFAELDWVKPCAALSGGERMRLLLCCISLMDQAPDLIVLDEPTNNLDIQNIEMLTRSLWMFKGSILAEVSQLTTPISRPIGLLWILAAMILLAFGILFLLDSEYGWIVGAVAIVLSQALILMYWGEAKFGTIPNVIIFVVVLVSYSQFTLTIGCNWY